MKLYNASLDGDNDTVKALLAEGVDINSAGGRSLYVDATPLMAASQNGHTDTVKILLAAGADVDAQRDGGETALVYADQAEEWKEIQGFRIGTHSTGHTDIVKLLLDAGADTELKDTLGSTVLIRASTSGHTDIVKLLLDAGADTEVKSLPLDFTALMSASMNGHTDVVKLLLDAGADVNATDSNEINTAYSMAKTRGHKEIVRLLKEAGADDGDRQTDDDEVVSGSDSLNLGDLAADFDRDGRSDRVDPDDDNDLVPDYQDSCLGTSIPESVPQSQHGLAENRWSLIKRDGSFTQAPPDQGRIFQITTQHTKGCSCEQIVDALGLDGSQLEHGCTTESILRWVNQ